MFLSEKGQGWIEWLVIIILFVWIFISILRIADCDGNLWRAILIWRQC